MPNGKIQISAAVLRHLPPMKVHYQPDRNDSARSSLRIIDASEHSLTHPQGPVTLATLNVAAFAPHMDQLLVLAQLLAKAPDLFTALSDMLSCADAGDLDSLANASATARAVITADANLHKD